MIVDDDVRISHRAAVLRTAREVDRLAAGQCDAGTLIQATCDRLVDVCGYPACQIVLTLGDAARVLTHRAQTGEGLPSESRDTAQDAWVRDAVEAREPIRCNGGTQLAGNDAGAVIAVALRENGSIFGAMRVRLPDVLAADEQELGLLSEVAHELAFAASTMRAAADRTAMLEELRQDREELRSGRDALDALIRNAPLALLSLDVEGRVLTWNPAAEDMFGWPAREAIGRVLPIVPPDKEEEFRSLVTRVVAGASFTGVELSRRRKDGAPIDLSVSTAPLRGADGAVFGLIAVTQDVSARKRAQAAAKLSESRLAALFELSQKSDATEDELIDYALEEAVRLTESDIGYFHFVADDQTSLTLSKWSAKVRESCTAVSDPHYPLAQAGVWADSARTKRPVVHNDYANVEGRKGIPEGHSPLVRHMSAPIVVGDLVAAIAGVANKPTDYDESDVRQLQLFLDGLWKLLQQKRAAAEQRRLEDQLRASQRLDAIGRLAGGIAHDFNNVLAVMNGYAELMMRDMREADPHHDFLREICDAGERAARLTRQLLAFSRKQVLDPEVLSLNDIVMELERMLHRTIGEHIELVTRLGDGLGPARLDKSQVEQVLLNLVVNARDAMPQGGTITIATSNEELNAAACAALEGLTPGSYVAMCVHDSGVGMDAATRERVFEPFFTTKGPGEGTGLGLSTVYGIVRQSGGAIRLESEPGRGACFTVFFPRSDAAAVDAPRASVRPAAVGGTETILVAEDDAAVRKLVNRFLADAGYRVLLAANAGEALLTCEQHVGPIHLLLADVVMPQMSGKALADRLALVRPDLKVLYMSGYEASVIARHDVLEDRAQLVAKPFTAIELTSRIRTLLDGD